MAERPDLTDGRLNTEESHDTPIGGPESLWGGLGIYQNGNNVETNDAMDLDRSTASDVPAPTELETRVQSGPATNRPLLENLRKRRASVSPEKFNTGQFEPLNIANPQAKFKKFKRGSDTPGNNHEIRGGTPAVSHSQRTPSLDSGLIREFDAAALDSSRPLTKSNMVYLLNDLHSDAPEARSKFNLFNGFLQHPELLYHLASFLDIPSLVSLYSISKPFHYLYNHNMTSFILATLRVMAPGIQRIYPWRCYRKYCIKDPACRLKYWLGEKAAEAITAEDIRDVPSLRWLQMVLWREGICQDILIQLAVKGLICPPGTLDAIKRMWFILDLPLNMQRRALIQSSTYITNTVIERMTFFLMKLDMNFSHPFPPSFPFGHPDQRKFPNRMAGALLSGLSLRKTLLAETSLVPLWRVLRGWSWDPSLPQLSMTRIDLLRLWVRHYYQPHARLAEHIRRQSIMGIPWYHVGMTGYERIGTGYVLVDGKRSFRTDPAIIGPPNMNAHKRDQLEEIYRRLYPGRPKLKFETEHERHRLLRPDELCFGESLRRKMGMHNKWIDIMLYEFCDEMGNPIPLRTEEQYSQMLRGLPPT